MDFTCNKDALSQAIGMAQRAAATKSPITLLEGMRVSAIGGEAVFYCTDKEIGIECTVPADIADEGEVVVNARLFGEVVRSLPRDNAHIRSLSETKIQVSSGDAVFELFIVQTDAFPPFPALKKESEYRIDQFTLKRMFQQTSFAIGVDDTRKNLTGLFLEGDGSELRAVAVDGFRIALRRQEVNLSDGRGAPGANEVSGDAGAAATSEPISAAGEPDIQGAQNGHGAQGVHGAQATKIYMIIPAKAVNELVKIIPSDKGELSLYGNRNQVVVAFRGCRMYTRVIDGEFFNYRYILPNEYVTQIVMEKQFLLNAVERAALILDAETMRRYPIVLKASGNTICVRALSDLGNVLEEIRADIDGEEIEAAFNPKFLIEALRAIDEDTILVRFTTRVGQILFLPVSHDGFAYLTLPVRVEGR